jgi:uncharacterized protein YebE (UPF0316 family)
MKLLTIFIVANLVNVIIQTIKSIATIKCGKVAAAIVNGLAYGFYTYIVILMSADLPLLAKCFIIGGCNLIGVYVVKLFEEKVRKDKLWKIELTVKNENANKLHEDLASFGIPHNYIENIGKWTIFNCYCATQKESAFVKEICDRNHAKYFVSETKIL